MFKKMMIVGAGDNPDNRRRAETSQTVRATNTFEEFNSSEVL
jgi:hypothetical protein